MAGSIALGEVCIAMALGGKSVYACFGVLYIPIYESLQCSTVV